MTHTFPAERPSDDTRRPLYQITDAAREALDHATAYASIGDLTGFTAELSFGAALVQAAVLALHPSGITEDRANARPSLVEVPRKEVE